MKLSKVPFAESPDFSIVLGQKRRLPLFFAYLKGLMFAQGKKNIANIAKLTPEIQHQALNHFINSKSWSYEPIIDLLAAPLVNAPADILITAHEMVVKKRAKVAIGVCKQWSMYHQELVRGQKLLSLWVQREKTIVPYRVDLHIPQKWYFKKRASALASEQPYRETWEILYGMYQRCPPGVWFFSAQLDPLERLLQRAHQENQDFLYELSEKNVRTVANENNDDRFVGSISIKEVFKKFSSSKIKGKSWSFKIVMAHDLSACWKNTTGNAVCFIRLRKHKSKDRYFIANKMPNMSCLKSLLKSKSLLQKNEKILRKRLGIGQYEGRHRSGLLKHVGLSFVALMFSSFVKMTKTS